MYGDGSATTMAKECECQQRRVNLWNIEHSGLVDVIDSLTFDSFCDKEPWQKTLKTGALHYLELLRNGGKHWMMISGQVGSGKTHLATAVMRELLFDGRKALYTTWRDIARFLKSYQLDGEGYDGAFSKMMRPDVLYIDDFLKGNITDGDKNVAYDIIDGRYKRNRATIITCEKIHAEIAAVDEAVGSRIAQKTGEFYFDIGRDGNKNIRKAGKGIVLPYPGK
jgi:DNA replication protein DnaC